MHFTTRMQEIPHIIFNPIDYRKGPLIGAGGYGDVMTCVNVHNGHTVAIKKSKKGANEREAAVLGKLMRRNFDRYNIVKFYGCHEVASDNVLVFEKLDIDLFRYMSKHEPIPMSDIRNIIGQMAMALTAMQTMELIHCDLKPDNIMIVDRKQSPISVKLIDFGLARHKSEVRQGMLLQIPAYRSPEVVLGLPITGAIDMWALGCIMARMITGLRLFNVRTEEELIRSMVVLLGQPEDHLLKKGIKSKRYFEKTGLFNTWRLKESKNPPEDRPAPLYLQSLDDLKRLGLESKEKDDAEERNKCVELLKAMLEVDPKKRITPFEVLKHPFIRRDDNKSSESTCLQTDSTLESESQGPTSTSGNVKIEVKPAAPENRLGLEGQENEDSSPMTLESTSDSSLGAISDESSSEELNWLKKLKKKMKKKKNCFSGFFSKLKKVFCCCVAGSEEEP